MRKDPTEFRKRFQSWKQGIPAYRAGKPIGEDEDTRSDTIRQGYHEGDIPYGAGNGPAGDSPLKILDIVNEETAAIPRDKVLIGEPPAVGLRNPGMFSSDFLARTFKPKGVGKAPMFMTEEVRRNTANLKAALGTYDGRGSSLLTKQAKSWIEHNKGKVDLSQFSAEEINKLVKMNRRDLANANRDFVLVDRNPQAGNFEFDVMHNNQSVADMIGGFSGSHLVPEMVESYSKIGGMSRKLYDAAIQSGKQLGYNGLVSGEYLISAPKTWSVWKHYLDKKLISRNGRHQNRMMTDPNKEGQLVKSMQEAKKAAAQNKNFTYDEGPVYLLKKESQFVPVKDKDVFDASILNPDGTFARDWNSKDITRIMLPFAVGGGLWGSKEHKNGKDLPRFAGGRDGVRYVPTDDGWGRITDSDVANLMENWVVTPFGVRNKFNYEYNPNYKQPVGKNAVVKQDNDLWTRQQVEKANNTRTWRSDAADIAHAVGEGAILASTFAAPEVEGLVYPAYQAAKSAATNAMRSSASRVLMNPRNFQFGHIELPPYEIQNIPGYQLKMLMRDNPLEKQLSKDGTISVNNIRAQANKASNVEKSVIEKILSSNEFSGQKSVDYNKFRKAVHDELITYDRIPDGRYEDYGMDRLGFRERHIWDIGNDPRFEGHVNPLDDVVEFYHRDTGDLVTRQERIAWQKEGLPKTNTFTFESPRIGIGNDKHYDYGTLGHSRTYTTQEEPDILHVMESQSDWGQDAFKQPRFSYNVATNGNTNIIIDEAGNAQFVGPGEGIPQREFLNMADRHNPNNPFNIANRQFKENTSIEQAKYLHDNYTHRQIQENLKYAAEKGQTKMRYPTPDTAAKIEGYTKSEHVSPRFEEINQRLRQIRREIDENLRIQKDPFASDDPIVQKINQLEEEEAGLINERVDLYRTAEKDYPAKHKTILKKYSDFPKQYRKIYKDADVRTVMDSKGNTWYEVDVPKNYLNSEWQYGLAPWIIGAGVGSGAVGAYANESTGFKNGKDIYIKPSHRGRLTALKKRTGKSEAELYRTGSAATRKMITFARNARKWKH